MSEAATVPQPAQARSGSKSVGKTVIEQSNGNGAVPLILGGALFIAIVAGMLMWANKPAYRVLYSGITEADGGAIIAELETRGVDYKIGAGGGAIMVPADQVHELRLKLAEHGLPDSGNVGFEIMDNQSFGISQFSEQVNFQRSLEGELAASIRALAPVKDARVHLALAKPAVFIRERDPSKASVLLHLHAGRTLGPAQVAAITHMVSSSVAELQPSDVSVVDQHGNLLSGNNEKKQEFDLEHLEYAEEVEKRYRSRIESMLRPIFGKDNFQVQVAADLDFSTHEETAERFAPNQEPEKAAVRSLQTTTKVENGDWPLSGVPGALSNTPPGWLPSPISEPATADAGEDQSAEEDSSSEKKAFNHNNTVNYEVDRSVIHTRREAGAVQRLSVAVVVNHKAVTNEEGVTEWVPLSAEETEGIEGLVQQAMGFSAARGDQLRVVNTKFAESPAAAVAPQALDTPWWQQPVMWRMAETVLKYLLVIIVLWFLYKKILKPLMERHARALENASLPVATNNQNRSGVEDQDDDDDIPEAKPAGKSKPKEAAGRIEYDLPIPKGDEGVAYEAALSKIRDMAIERPEAVAQTVSRWINQG